MIPTYSHWRNTNPFPLKSAAVVNHGLASGTPDLFYMFFRPFPWPRSGLAYITSKRENTENLSCQKESLVGEYGQRC